MEMKMFFFFRLGLVVTLLGVWNLVEGRAPRKGRPRQQVQLIGTFFFQPILSQEMLMLRCRVCYERRHDHRMCSRCPEHGELLIHVRDHLPKKKDVLFEALPDLPRKKVFF